MDSRSHSLLIFVRNHFFIFRTGSCQYRIAFPSVAIIILLLFDAYITSHAYVDISRAKLELRQRLMCESIHIMFISLTVNFQLKDGNAWNILYAIVTGILLIKEIHEKKYSRTFIRLWSLPEKVYHENQQVKYVPDAQNSFRGNSSSEILRMCVYVVYRVGLHIVWTTT